MARIKDFGVQQTVLHEADTLLVEYEKLAKEMQQIKSQALDLYAEVEKSRGKTQVAEALEKILNIPE